jgi:hypothetical protein
MRYPKRTKKTGQIEQGNAGHLHDNLAEYEDFREKLLPMLRKDLLTGLTTAQMREKYLPLLEARKIQIGLLEADSAKAMTAIKDVADRHEGRPVERKAIAHRFESMPDTELDALLVSKLKAIASSESENE